VWNVLERGDWKFDLVLVNPQHVRALPGRKTDQQDCERLAELGQYDLLRGSFIPPQAIRELRDLTRYRAHLQGDRNRLINRIRRLLETANYKLGSVASNIVGKTGWLILNAIAAGKTSPEWLAEQAQGSLQNKKAELARALYGYSSEHFRWLLRRLVDQIAQLDKELNQVDLRIRARMEPYADLVRRLCTMPCVQETTAWMLIAELGTDMSHFPDAAHVASWAGLCPGNCESAGKRQSGRTRKGNRYLRRMLIQNAWAVTRKKNCALKALFYRVAARGGRKRAAVAVAHRLLIIAYCILRDGSEYREVGGNYYDRQNPERTAKRLMRRLEQIGYQVTLTKPEPQPERVTPIRNGTTRWGKPSFKPKPSGSTGPVATPELCRKCAKWGIPCVHARNANLPLQRQQQPTSSTT
jgi:transposase